MEETRMAPSSAMAQLASLIGDCDVVDLGPELFTNMHKWWSHPDLQIITDSRNFEQNGYFLQTLVLPEHLGCHVDAPIHNHPAMADRTMAYYPPDCVFGPAKKVDVGALDLQPGELPDARAVRDGRRLCGRDRRRGRHPPRGVRMGRQPARWRERPPGRLVGQEQPWLHRGAVRLAGRSPAQGRRIGHGVRRPGAGGRGDRGGVRPQDLVPAARESSSSRASRTWPPCPPSSSSWRCRCASGAARDRRCGRWASFRVADLRRPCDPGTQRAFLSLTRPPGCGDHHNRMNGMSDWTQCAVTRRASHPD